MKRLLVVDDDQFFARMLGLLLKHYGWTTAIVRRLHGNSAEAGAMETLRGERFDAVLLDLNLPDSLWRETVDRLTEIRELALGARLVVTSGFVPPGVIPDGACDAILPKVFAASADRLIEAITPRKLLHNGPPPAT